MGNNNFNIYIFKAVLTREEDGISISYPDLQGCVSCASDIDEAIKNAREALELHLWGLDRDGDKIPDVDITEENVKDNVIEINISVNLDEVKADMLKEADKKREDKYMESIVQNIKNVNYIHHENRVTICLIETKSNFFITGESFCIDSNYYKKEIGEKISYNRALNKLMEYDAYLNKNKEAIINIVNDSIDEVVEAADNKCCKKIEEFFDKYK